MPKPDTVRAILNRLAEAGLQPHYEPLPPVAEIKWDALPEGVDPSWGGLPAGRLERKQRQLACLFSVVLTVLRRGDRIVDFGSSSGHVGLPLAHQMPDCRVLLLDMKEVPLNIAHDRIDAAGLENVDIFCGQVVELDQAFDLGVGLHVCGDGTDQVMDQCIENRAAYVLCPCDLGALQRSSRTYPRSRRCGDVIPREDFNRLAKAADWTSWKFADEKCLLALEASAWLALDRNLYAEERGYATRLFQVDPAEAGLKSMILAGIPLERQAKAGA